MVKKVTRSKDYFLCYTFFMEDEIQDINQVLNEPTVVAKKSNAITTIFVVLVVVLLAALGGLFLLYKGII
jgi:hypothetical protein